MRRIRAIGLRAKDEGRYRLLKALINVYGGEASRYINYYGPPGTIPTIHYDQALQIGTETGPAFDVKGKAVFVGLSEILLAERKDSFYTVFSQGNGVFIGGVEIAASAFLNILGDATIVPISLPAHVGLLLCWGIGVGVLCRLLPISLRATAGIACRIHCRCHQFGLVPARDSAPSSCRSIRARFSGTISNRIGNEKISVKPSGSICRTMWSINWPRTWRISKARLRWSTEPACLPMPETIPRCPRK
jgi:hypothetical protein